MKINMKTYQVELKNLFMMFLVKYTDLINVLQILNLEKDFQF